jgi:hypothetical protein
LRLETILERLAGNPAFGHTFAHIERHGTKNAALAEMFPKPQAAWPFLTRPVQLNGALSRVGIARHLILGMREREVAGRYL